MHSHERLLVILVVTPVSVICLIRFHVIKVFVVLFSGIIVTEQFAVVCKILMIVVILRC